MNQGFKTCFSVKLRALSRKSRETQERKITALSKGGFLFWEQDFYSHNWYLSPDRLRWVSSLLSDYTIQQASQFLTATNAPNKKHDLKCFFSFSNSPVTLEPDCSPFSSLKGLQEVWLLCRSFCLSSPKISPLTEGLTQAITHQVPAAVVQVSMAAAIRRQQCDGKVRNFLNIGSSKAGVLRQISAHRLWTTIIAPTEKPLLLQSGIFWGGIKQTQQGERDHTCARRTWFMFVFKAQVAFKVPKH